MNAVVPYIVMCVFVGIGVRQFDIAARAQWRTWPAALSVALFVLVMTMLLLVPFSSEQLVSTFRATGH